MKTLDIVKVKENNLIAIIIHTTSIEDGHPKEYCIEYIEGQEKKR